ncbi:MAG TPA: ATP-binding protein [Catenuloplanes sp.]
MSYLPGPGPADETPQPALQGVLRACVRVAVALRAGSALVAAWAAQAGAGPPASPHWITIGTTALLLWAAVFAWLGLRHGLTDRLLTMDAAGMAMFCLAHRKLVPAETFASVSGTGWVDLLASSAVFIASLRVRFASGLVVAAGIAGAYTVGRWGLGFSEMPIVLMLQALLAGGVMILLRRAVTAADLALANRIAATVAAAASAAVRADERDQQRSLPDTAVATLTMVGTGAIVGDSPVLRARAAADLVVLNQLRTHPDDDVAAGTRTARLDLALRAIATTVSPGLPDLDVRLDAQPIELPRPVASAMTDSVAEALTNVARHAGTSTVLIRAREHDRSVSVEVVDGGRGFDPAGIPAHRRGWRESIAGRMNAIGGTAEIVSTAGAGTTVVLGWHHG